MVPGFYGAPPAEALKRPFPFYFLLFFFNVRWLSSFFLVCEVVRFFVLGTEFQKKMRGGNHGTALHDVPPNFALCVQFCMAGGGPCLSAPIFGAGFTAQLRFIKPFSLSLSMSLQNTKAVASSS